MFGFGKQKTNGIVNIDKNRAINLDQVPVINMRQDLENILRGTYNSPPASSGQAPQANIIDNTKNVAPPPPPSQALSQPSNNPPANLTEKYKSSPFLGPNDKVEPVPTPRNTPETPEKINVSFQQNQNTIPQADTDQTNPTQNETISIPVSQPPTQPQPIISGQSAMTNNTQSTYRTPSNKNVTSPQINQNPSVQTNQSPATFPPNNFSTNSAQQNNIPGKQPLIKPSFKMNSSPAPAPAPTMAQPVVQKMSLPIQNQSPAMQGNATEHSQKEPAWGKLLFFAILLFVIFISFASAYYWWLTKNSKNQNSFQESSQSSQIETKKTSLATDQTNLISLDIDNMDKYQIKSAIKKYADDVVSSNMKEAIEFNLQNSKNEPIKFELFSDKTEIRLPISVLYNLNSDFRIFAYNDNQKPFLGLSIGSKDDGKLTDTLVGEEMNLAKSLEFLYFTSGYNPESNSFVQDSYGGAAIRSLEINSSEQLSFSYTIYKNKLLVGTSKLTLRSMIDYLNKDTAVQGAEDIVN